MNPTLHPVFRHGLPVLLLFLCAAPVSAQDIPDLFLPAPVGRSTLTAEQVRLLRVIEQRPGSKDVQLRRAVAPQALAALPTVAVGVGGEQVRIARERIATAHGERLVWAGRFGEGGEVLLVVDGDQITGTVQKPSGEMFKIEPLGGGLHTVSRIDQTAVGECATESGSRQDGGEGGTSRVAPQSIRSSGFSSTMTTPNIDVLVVYTPAAAAASTNIGNEIALAVADMNNGFGNSSVPATVSVVHQAQLAFNESSDIVTDRNDLMGTSDGRGDAVHSIRSQYAADVVVLLTDGNYLYQGQSTYGIAGDIGAAASKAFAIVEWDYATGYHTFAHEIGHLAGARHDNDTNTQPYPYGHGYRPSGYSWRTIMATGSPSSTPFRINYWSNPDKVYGGVAMGTTSYRDNARVWEDRAATMAAFKTPIPPVGPLTASVSGPGLLGWKQNGTYTASYSGGSGTVSYAWSLRPTGGVWQPTGLTGSTYALSMVYTGGVDVKVDVTRGSQTASATKHVNYCTSAPPCIDELRAEGLEGLEIAYDVPAVFAVHAPRPNPARGPVEVPYDLPESAEVTATVYDVVGREVLRVREGIREAGEHQLVLDPSGLPAGTYVVRVVAGAESATHRMVVAR